MGRTIFREKVVKNELPSGYDWRLESYSDDEGIVVTVTLVQSPYKAGSWLDRIFGRRILNSAFEVELEASDEEIDAKIATMKNKITSVFFNWRTID
jgi:hypothetical protein